MTRQNNGMGPVASYCGRCYTSSIAIHAKIVEKENSRNPNCSGYTFKPPRLNG